MVFELLRTVLGLGSSDSTGETDVTVERRPDDGAAGTDGDAHEEAATAGTDAAASTGSMTEEPPATGAAEPAEAAGPTDGGEAVSVEEVSGIGPAYAERLSTAGVDTVGDLLAADPEKLADSTDISAKRIGRWQDRAEGS
ncbi:hypothetical protein BRD05_08165 [Halobacteriales archaeon QS_9_70_65]|nr:MAG: hypothetical protein BRD05_08165 [Halobacteriales archaeon QS_9_70_65]